MAFIGSFQHLAGLEETLVVEVVQGQPVARLAGQIAGVRCIRCLLEQPFDHLKTLLILPLIKMVPGFGEDKGGLLPLQGGLQRFHGCILSCGPVRNHGKRRPGSFQQAPAIWAVASFRWMVWIRALTSGSSGFA